MHVWLNLKYSIFLNKMICWFVGTAIYLVKPLAKILDPFLSLFWLILVNSKLDKYFQRSSTLAGKDIKLDFQQVHNPTCNFRLGWMCLLMQNL